MKGKHIVLLLAIAGIAMLFFGASINAEEAASSDVIENAEEAASSDVIENAEEAASSDVIENAEEAASSDVIKMENTDAFAKHKKSIVTFEHKKHHIAAPDGYGIACGECHHDKDGKPLELKECDTVQGCMECHDKAEKPKKPKGLAKADWKKMKLEYYYGALHANCIGCHKEGGAGPVKCAECHPKPEKK